MGIKWILRHTIIPLLNVIAHLINRRSGTRFNLTKKFKTGKKDVDDRPQFISPRQKLTFEEFFGNTL